MHPDLEEYASRVQPAAEPRSRVVSWLVLGVAVAGFASLAWYAYNSGSNAVTDENALPTIMAETSDIRTEPTDAGGEEFPHQDKTIYDTISGNNQASDGQNVEALLPEPETPVVPKVVTEKRKETAPEETNTWVSKALRESENDEAPAPERAAESSPELKEGVVRAEAPVLPEAPKVPAAVKPPATEEKTHAPVKAKTEEKAQETPAAPAPVAAAKQAAAPAAAKPAPMNGAFKVQLGAYKSQEEANANWVRIRRQFSDVLGGASHAIIKADLPNGTFYRLRASGFASAAAAKEACTKISARGQGCFFAGQ